MAALADVGTEVSCASIFLFFSPTIIMMLTISQTVNGPEATVDCNDREPETQHQVSIPVF
jgi:hypothetical protein